MNKKLSSYLNTLVFMFFLFVFLFTRSFMGIYIFGFRIGEYAIFSSLLFLLLYIFLNNKYKLFEIFKENMVNNLTYLLFVTFLIFLFISNTNLTDTYIFKASSYIWTIGYLFFAYIVTEKLTLNKFYINSSLLILIYIYYVAINDLPQSVQEFFLSISDKYEPHKGSDILIMFVCILYLFIRVNNKRIGLEGLFAFSSLFFPLLLYKSRGAFIALVLYFILELYRLRSYVFNVSYLRNIALVAVSAFILLQSVFLVTDSGALKITLANEKLDQVTQYRAPEIKPGEYVNYLYLKDNRFYSTDVNINWRIQIWQDVVRDLRNDKKLLIGIGYSEKIPAMAALDFEGNSVRSGLDGLNENVHNYFVNILARGGLVHLLIFLTFYFLLIKIYRQKFNDLNILVLMVPVLFAAFFDSAMENSHYPLIFYFILGMSFHGDRIYKEPT